MSSCSNSRATHVLIFPYPAQGHMLPLLDLTHQLSLKNLDITILITPKNLPIVSSLLDARPAIQTLVLPFPSHPSVPAGVENVKELGNRGNLPIMSALGKLYDPIIQWFHSHANPPVAILSDFFLGWTLNLARELNIVRITFFSSGSFLASVSDYCWNHTGVVKSLDVVEFRDLPRSPVFKEEHLPTVFRIYMVSDSDPEFEFVKDGMVANTLSWGWGCVFNSFDDLESEYLDYLKRKMGHDRVFGVGPLSLLGPESTRGGDSGLDPNDNVSKWLDGCPDGSVVYACFGSQKVLSKEQMEALALGLEKSGIRFLWVVKTSVIHAEGNGYGLIPYGFEERVAGRGLVLKGWVPQADQFVNARLLVDDLRVAVLVCEGGDSVPDSDELGKVIGESLSQCGETKIKARELRDKALAAVKSGGSSTRDLETLVQELRKLRFHTSCIKS
ncbi:hypothetical protein CISIN_1g044731mg [Citrus sinensis]|uniref:Uncharacterized protein n=1 Tax=Citrus sinensis TaxID=2711 RepID=A0A067G3J6_CITSI|nr:hypothetical protein CISIN_1g044731mg [Citrus sinensis]